MVKVINENPTSYSMSAAAEQKTVRAIRFIAATLGFMTLGVFAAIFATGEKIGEFHTVLEYNGQAILRVEHEVRQIREVVVDPIDGRLREVEVLMSSVQRAIDEGWLPRAQEEITELRAEIAKLRAERKGGKK